MRLNVSVADFKAGQFDNAANSAAAALKIAPDLAPAMLFLGAAQLQLGNFQQAAASLERVVSINPGDRNACLLLADALAGSGRTADAASGYRALTEQLPGSPHVWYGLGRMSEALGDTEQARQAWQRLDGLPPSPESHMHRAEQNEAALRWRMAATEWREALNLDPQNRKARTGLAWSLFRARAYEETLETLKPLMDNNASPDVLFLQGAALMNMQMPAQAIRPLESAVAKRPGMLEARAALGQALLQTGKVEAAISHLNAAVSIDRDGTIHFQLFRAYQLMDRKAEAQRALAAYHQIRENQIRENQIREKLSEYVERPASR